MESLLKSVEALILGLPPLLQMLLGIFAMIGLIKLFMFSVDFIEDRTGFADFIGAAIDLRAICLCIGGRTTAGPRLVFISGFFIASVLT